MTLTTTEFNELESIYLNRTIVILINSFIDRQPVSKHQDIISFFKSNKSLIENTFNNTIQSNKSLDDKSLNEKIITAFTTLYLNNTDTVSTDNYYSISEINNILNTVTNNSDNNNYEYVNHPSHYNNYNIEVIDMMRKIWGDEATKQWCIMTAFKYRMRMGNKPDNPIQQDLNKEQWYLNMANSIKSDNTTNYNTPTTQSVITNNEKEYYGF